MKINGVDILEYGAKQWNVSMSYVSVKNDSEFLNDALVPYLAIGAIGMKKIKVSVLIQGSSRKEIWKNGSRLIFNLLKPAIVELKGFTNKFHVVLTNADQVETSIERWHKATLELTGYEFGEEENVTLCGKKEFFVDNPGSLETPMRVELLPRQDTSELIIKGICRAGSLNKERDIKVKNLKENEAIIIDWKTGLIQTVNGESRFSNVEFWGFPSLLPGSNYVELSTDTVDITLQFNPLFM